MENVILPDLNQVPVFLESLPQKLIKPIEKVQGPTPIWAWQKSFVKTAIWLNILWVALTVYKNPVTVLKKLKTLLKMRNQYRNDGKLQKYFYANNKYYYNYNAPGWPSLAFNRYVTHLFKKTDVAESTSLHTLIFAITKKCGFKCEHCCEWEALNKPEVLSREDLLKVINNFYAKGISQVQLSGGEPLNRLEDIFYLLTNSPKPLNFWIYTTGYNLSFQKAKLLKENGLTGITISLDHWDATMHDSFRGKPGSYQRALNAIRCAVENSLAVTLSICATKSFINEENLYRYAQLAKDNHVTFIQVLEPKAVGHYQGQDVILQKQHTDVLEKFYENMNYNKDYKAYPIVAYHGYYSRRVGCSGSGKDYLYVDTDGDVHNCPFCQRKIFSAIHGNIDDELIKMKEGGCGVFNSNAIKN
ncbi:MAG: radical SAM protein [Ferruginibacter sp.]